MLIIIQELLLWFAYEMDKGRVLNESARGILVRYSDICMCNTRCMVMQDSWLRIEVVVRCGGS